MPLSPTNAEIKLPTLSAKTTDPLFKIPLFSIAIRSLLYRSFQWSIKTKSNLYLKVGIIFSEEPSMITTLFFKPAKSIISPGIFAYFLLTSMEITLP